MILVDANVLIDLLADDPAWRGWSEHALTQAATDDRLAVNPVVFAEIAPHFDAKADADRWLAAFPFILLELPYEAAFAAGRAHAAYRRAGGDKRAPMPDFYIGAHAQVGGLTLLTRDVRRYRTYFPHVRLIAPPGG